MHSTAMRLTLRAAAIALTVAATYWLVWMPWYANHVLSDVEARSRAAMNSGDPMMTAVAARRNIAALERVASVTRDDANFYMLYAANARFVNNLDLAAAQYTAALQYADHRPEIYYERGLVYLSMGNVDAAVADLAHAARFNPFIVNSLSGELQRRVRQAAGIP